MNRLSLCIAVTLLVPCAAAAAADVPATMPGPKGLPTREEMPDPLVMNDGTRVTTAAQWRARREEMKAILEEYEYGHMPPAPGNVKGRETVAAKTLQNGVTYRQVRLSFGPGEKLGFDLGIFTPPASEAVKPPFPAFISLSFAAGENSARQYTAALERGYAVVAVPYGQLGADNANTWRQSAFFPSYPEHDWRDIAAWAWGLSRAVDYLQDDPAIDKTKLATVGVSRCAQAVLLAGAFDERIALSAPVAGGMAFRFSGKGRGGKQGVDEIVDQNTYWFGPRFPEFKGHTDKLPFDQHWLPALTAPRAFLLCCSLADQYGNANAAAQSYLHAKPVYEFLGKPEAVGINFRPGSHGMNAEDWSALLDFADVHLMGKAAARRFDQIPPADQLH
jgi:hypothetical protein